MKIITAALLLLSSASFADCFPEEWRLPNKGKGCELVALFGQPRSAQLWSCPEPESELKSLFLMTGALKKNHDGETCFIIDKLEKEIPREE